MNVEMMYHQVRFPCFTFSLSPATYFRRKKKCIRCSEGDGDSAPKPDESPLEDDVMTSTNQNGTTHQTDPEGDAEELPVANTTFGALVDIETTKNSSSSNQSNSTAPPPVAVGNQTAAT